MNIHELVRFLDSAPTSNHATDELEARLRQRGFAPLTRGERAAAPSFVRFGNALIAIRPGTQAPDSAGFRIAAAHSDSPALVLKWQALRVDDGLIRVPTEVYGGPIVSSWLDRDLQVAGRIALQTADGVEVRSVATRRGVGVIPNAAIHINRKVNEGYRYNRQTQLGVMLGATQAVTVDPAEFFAAMFDIKTEQLIDAELMAIPAEPATLWGDGMISSARLDNLLGSLSVVLGLAETEATPHWQLAVVFDNEEIHSLTAFGAAGSLLRQVLRAQSDGDAAFARAMERSVLISNDATHAYHPAFADKQDSAYTPRAGAGPAIKRSAFQKYANSLEAIAWLRSVADKASIPLQVYRARSDVGSGGTIGPMIASDLAIHSVEVGAPVLAMHATRETMSTSDAVQLTALMQAVLAAPGL